MSVLDAEGSNTLPTHFAITIGQECQHRIFTSRFPHWKYPAIAAIIFTSLLSIICDWHPLAVYLRASLAHFPHGHVLPEVGYLPVAEVTRPGRVMGFKLPLLPRIPIPDFLHPPPNWTTDTSTTKEAYVTFLADIDEPYYYNAVRTQLFQIKHHRQTRDSTRDYVVLNIPHVPPILEQTLRSEGALIIRRPLLTSFQGQVDATAPHPYKDQFSKPHILNLSMSGYCTLMLIRY